MATTKKSRCACGKVKSKYLPRCRKCEAEHEAERIASAQAIVSTGKCPYCDRLLKRNLALTGWWQCEQYGSIGFRADNDAPQCSFQTFTA